MNDRKLKECPFCGSEAIINKIRVSYSDYNYDGYAVIAECKVCKAKSPYMWGTIHGMFRENEEKQAIEAWNRRVCDEQYSS